MRQNNQENMKSATEGSNGMTEERPQVQNLAEVVNPATKIAMERKLRCLIKERKMHADVYNYQVLLLISI